MSAEAQPLSIELSSFLKGQGLKGLDDKQKGGSTLLHLVARFNRLDLLKKF